MFQIAFLTLGLVVLTLVIAFIFKKQQRVILWAAALILFIGTCLMIGLGVVNIYENGVVNQNTLFSVILAFFCSAKFACDAEKTHRALQKKAATLVEQSSNPPNDDKDKAAMRYSMPHVPSWKPVSLNYMVQDMKEERQHRQSHEFHN